MLFLAVEERTPIWDALRGLCAYICQLAYTLMAWTWSLLLDVSKIRLLNSGGCSLASYTTRMACIDAGAIWTDSAITSVYKRFTLLLGIIMTFYIIFQFIKYLMTPEEIEDKEKGIEKLGFKLLTVVVLLAITPMLFDKAYDLQKIILDNQILSKLVLGRKNMHPDKFGRAFAVDLLSNFYYTEGFEDKNYFNDNGTIVESGLKCRGNKDCNYTVNGTMAMFLQNGQLTGLHYGLNSYGDLTTGEKDVYYIHFDGLLALIVGILITYMLILYTLDIGARVIQFTFLQVIAPIPIIAYLSPKKDGTFQKWLKQCGTTYLDLFIRLGILYFVTLLIEAINEEYQNHELLTGITGATSSELFIYLVLIIGLMTFCKRAPKMVQELFPSMGVASGTFGLKPGDRPLVSNAIGLLGGAATGLRTMAMRTVSQIRRNKDNRDLRKEAEADYAAKQKGVKDKNDEIRALRKKKGTMSEAEYNANMARLKEERRQARASRRDAGVAVSNTRYRSAALAGLGGLAGGAVRGAAKGATLSDIKSFKDFRGKMEEVEKAEDQRTAAVDTWYNAGGEGGITGTIKRGVAGVESRFGLETPKARMEQQIKTIDNKIKTNDAYANIEADTKSKRDEVENRLKDKIKNNDLKTTIGTSLFTNAAGHKTIKGLEKMDIDLASVLTSQEKNAAGGNVDAALQKLKFTELVGRYSSATEQASAELKKMVDEGGHTDDEIAEAKAKLQKAQEEESAVTKHAMRNAFTQALQNPDSFADKVALDKIENSKTSIKVARSNSDVVSRFLAETDKELQKKKDAIDADTSLSSSQKAAAKSAADSAAAGEKALFLGQKDFTKSNYDELDEVVVRLNNIAADRKRENQERSEEKRKIETSYRYDAAKADDAFNSSTSGKK